MSVTVNTDDEWEFSKENIQPLQHGRKPDILKLALRENPEDPIQQRQQVFENELRTYSGDDPLSVWFEYINWVEQNFLKGGRDGHFEHLVKKCVTMFKDDKKYCDDKRFIAIWLKFANVSTKATEVFNYMYSHNIGCYTAGFYVAWSWELERQDNIKKANQVLYEGINRNADPVERLKSYLSEFEIRVSQKLSEHLASGQSPGAENQRSAFSILKTHKKSAPVERTGETVLQPSRFAMTLGHSQPATRNESSSKMPFKIFSNINNAPSLPVQKVGNVPFVFHTDSVKENEIKPSKWNKVKVKQTVPINQPSSGKNLDFDIHHDEGPQPICTPRPVPKVSNVLRSHHYSKSPAMALFEPFDQMKCPMYDKNKVYGGAEEFSLEEIRAAAWLKKHNSLEVKKNYDSIENSHDLPVAKKSLGFAIYPDENKQVTPLGQQKYLSFNANDPERVLLSPMNPMKCPIYDRNLFYKGEEELSFEEIKANAWFKSNKALLEKNGAELKFSQQHEGFNVTNEINCQNHNSLNNSNFPSSISAEPKGMTIKKEDFSENGLISPQFQPNTNGIVTNENQSVLEKSKVDLFHSNLSNLNVNPNQEDNMNKQFDKLPFENYSGQNLTENFQGKCSNSTSYHEAANMLAELYNGTIANPIDAILRNEYLLATEVNSSSMMCSQPNTNVNQMELPFALFHDPTENNLVQNSDVQQDSDFKSNTNTEKPPFKIFEEQMDNLMPNNVVQQDSDFKSNINKEKLPFKIFEEQIDNLMQNNFENNLVQNNVAQQDSNFKSIMNKEKPFKIFEEPMDYIMQNNVNGQTSNHLKGNLPFNFYEDPIENILKNPIPEMEAEPVNDENAENVPPKNYVQDTIKREMSGILTPSQNIMFVPLEMQENEEDESDPEDIEINKCVQQDETLFPPCNTEQFCSAPFISSTPLAKNIKKPNLQISEETYQLGGHTSDAKEEQCVSTSQGVADPVTEKQAYRPEKISGMTRPISSLSVIMETSKESYKSSASSGSSASATRLSQFEQYHSYEKSNITHKDYSRADTFKEPKPVALEHIPNIKKTIQVSEAVEKPKAVLCGDVDDPFDKQLTEKLLQSLKQPPNYHKNLDITEKKLRFFKVGDVVEIKQEKYTIEKMVAEGAYGKVYVAEKESPLKDGFCHSFSSKVALKTCKRSNEWELYICFVLHERLLHMKSIPDVRLSVMNILTAKKYSDGMVLISEYCSRGTLLDLVNLSKQTRKPVSEPLALYLTLELLQIMLKIHECRIIHTDIKPDNILVRNLPCTFNSDCFDVKTSVLQFIDFGRSIDLNFFETGVRFNTPMKNRCNEVLENKPWVHQLDWCGILDCIHVLLFQDYMKVKKNQNGRWCLESRFKRYQATEIWSPLFDELLNIPACYEEPNISEHVARIKAKLPQNADCIEKELQKMYL